MSGWLDNGFRSTTTNPPWAKVQSQRIEIWSCSWFSANGSSKAKTWTCVGIGHIKRFCPKQKEKPQHRAKISEDKVDSDSDSEGAFPAAEKVLDGTWLVEGAIHQASSTFYTWKGYPGWWQVVEAAGVGTIQVEMLFKVSSSKRAVMYVLHVPKLSCNLFSVRAVAKRGNTVKFGPSRCWIRGPNKILQGMGSLVEKFYHLQCEVTTNKETAVIGVRKVTWSWSVASTVRPSKPSATTHSCGLRPSIWD